MTSSEARSAILAALARAPMTDLYRPGTRTPYDAPEIVSLLRLSPDVRDYYVRANNLSRAAIHASIDKALVERERWVRTGKRDPGEQRRARVAISKGAKAFATRGVQAEVKFLEYAERHGGLSRAEAEKTLAAYRKARVIRIDHVTGDFHVKHGAFLDRSTLRRAAGLE